MYCHVDLLEVSLEDCNLCLVDLAQYLTNKLVILV